MQFLKKVGAGGGDIPDGKSPRSLRRPDVGGALSAADAAIERQREHDRQERERQERRRREASCCGCGC